MNTNLSFNYILITTVICLLFCFEFKKKNKTLLLLIYVVLLYILYKYTYSFYNISSYYQLINYLNNKNNFIILIILYYLKKINKNKYSVNKILILILLYTLFDYNLIEVNKLYFIYYNNTNTLININLLNGIMLIHPVILYIYYTSFLYTIHNTYIYMYNVYLYCNNKTHIYNMSLYILISTLLGCWWAEQELSWGGWWSWDLVELLALNFFSINLISMHANNKQLTRKNYRNILIYLCVFITTLVFVRFNIINSIHNFVNIESQNQFLFYIKYIYICVVLCIMYLLYNYKIKYIYFVSTYFVIITYVMYSYILYIYIFKNNFNINFLYTYNYILVLIYFLNKNEYVICYTPILIPFFFKNVSYIDSLLFFIVVGILAIFKKNFNNTNKYIHISLIIILYFIWHQLYIFNFTCNSIIYTNLVLIKLNYACINTYVYMYDFYYNIFFNIKLYLLYMMEVKSSLNIFINNSFKSVFEKSMLIHNSLYEMYNYNLQQLDQPNSTFIFLMFIFLMFIFLMFIQINYKIIFI